MKVLCSVRTLILLTIWAGGIGMILGVVVSQSATTPLGHSAVAVAYGGEAPRIEAINRYAPGRMGRAPIGWGIDGAL